MTEPDRNHDRKQDMTTTPSTFVLPLGDTKYLDPANPRKFADEAREAIESLAHSLSFEDRSLLQSHITAVAMEAWTRGLRDGAEIYGSH